jgi:hypothetical protein
MKVILAILLFLYVNNGFAQQDTIIDKFSTGEIKSLTTTDSSNHIQKTIYYNEDGSYLKTEMFVIKNQHSFSLLQFVPDTRPDSINSLAGNYHFKLTFEGTPIFREFLLTINPDSTFHLYKYVYESCYNYIKENSGDWTVNDGVLHLNISLYTPSDLRILNNYLISDPKKEIDGKMRTYEFKKVYP